MSTGRKATKHASTLKTRTAIGKSTGVPSKRTLSKVAGCVHPSGKKGK